MIDDTNGDFVLQKLVPIHIVSAKYLLVPLKGGFHCAKYWGDNIGSGLLSTLLDNVGKNNQYFYKLSGNFLTHNVWKCQQGRVHVVSFLVLGSVETPPMVN
jgi:hypothetical protein